MNPSLDGRWFRSEPYTYATGSSFAIRPDPLANARYMAAPEVADLLIRFSGTVGGVTGGALGRDFAKLVDQVRFTDEAEMVNLSGVGVRALEQVEWGDGSIDPGDVASGATNTSYEAFLRITFEPPKSHRPRDYRVPLEHFLEGGELLVVTAAALPTGWAAVQADQRLQIFWRVVDGRTKELKTRRRLREEGISQQEFAYQVNGAIRTALVTSKLTTTGYTSLAAFTTIYSRTLDMLPTMQVGVLRDQYRKQSRNGFSAVDENLLATPGSIPLVTPKRDERIGQMVDTKTLHLDLLAAAPTSGRLVTDVVVDRTPNLAAMVAGYPTLGEYQAAMKAYGTVVDGRPGGSKITSYRPELARRLPVRLKI